MTSLLSDTINKVRSGALDPRTSNAIGYLAAVMLKALQQGDIEARLQALEAVQKARNQRKSNPMDADSRLKSLESSLENKERVLAWFKKAQALGGFFDYCKVAKQPFLIEDQESAFLFRLVNLCNGEVLEILASPVKHLLAIYLVRLARTAELEAHEVERQRFPVLLLNFVVEGLALEGAIEQVGKVHFGGTQMLFGDLQNKLTERNQAAKQLLRGYNVVAPTAGFEPITDDELKSAVSEATTVKADELVRLSRAEAAALFRYIHEAREELRPILEDDGLRQFIMQPLDNAK